MNNKGFSFIELIISITILVLVSVIGYSSLSDYNSTKNNSKIVADIQTIKNAAETMKIETKVSLPDGNKNYFDSNGNYSSSGSAYGVYGKVTEKTFPKRYLDNLPLDPNTNQYYSYGVALEENQIETAGVIIENNNFKARLTGNYTAENGLFSLIRGYNSPYFVTDEGTILPYNPEEKVFTITDIDGNIYREGDRIETTEDKEFFLTDGSVIKLEANTKITLSEANFPKDTNLVTNVKLFLEAGSIWTKATKLDEDSHFEVFTSDATAAVRGTIFNVTKNTSSTQVNVIEGVVEVKANQSEEINEVNSGESINIENGDSIESTNTDINTDEIFEDYGNKNDNIIEVDDNINEIINTDDKSCILGGKEVENGSGVIAYSISNGSEEECNNNKTERICINGEFLGLEEYKYSDCNPVGTCGRYNLDSTFEGFSLNEIIENKEFGWNGSYKISKNIPEGDEINGTIEATINIKCENGDYITEKLDSEISCKDGYEENEEGNSCIIDCGEGGLEYQPGSCASNELGEEWQVNVFIPFNENLNIYFNDNSIKNKSDFGTNSTLCGKDNNAETLNKDNSITSLCKNYGIIDGKLVTSDNNIYSIDGVKGLFLDNINNDDFLLYNDLNLSGNFAIEMSVRGEALKRKTTTSISATPYYLFNYGNIYLDLYDGDGNLYLGYGPGTNNVRKITIDSSLINDDSFYTVTAIFEGDNWDLKIDNSIGSTHMANEFEITNFSSLYIGSKKDRTDQWNDIIDYVKIYKK